MAKICSIKMHLCPQWFVLLFVLKQWFCSCWFIVNCCSIFVGVLCWSLFCCSIYFVSFWFCNHLDGKERAGCFTLTVFLMYCDSQWSVALPHGAVGWSAVYDCRISWSYSLAFFYLDGDMHLEVRWDLQFNSFWLVYQRRSGKIVSKSGLKIEIVCCILTRIFF